MSSITTLLGKALGSGVGATAWYSSIAELTSWYWTFTPSLAYVGQGMIMGPKTGFSMLIGAILGWGILGPYARSQGWAPGPISNWETGAKGWILWISLSIMLADSFCSLLLIVVRAVVAAVRKSRTRKRSTQQDRRHFLKEGQPYAGRDNNEDVSVSTVPNQSRYDSGSGSDAFPTDVEVETEKEEEDEEERGEERREEGGGVSERTRNASTSSRSRGERSSSVRQRRKHHHHQSGAKEGERHDIDPAPLSERVPRPWWVFGLIVSTILCIAVLSPIFNMPVYEPLVAVVLAMLVSILAVRALGETDLNPVSGVGKVSQIVFGLISPGRVLPNLVAGAIAEAGAQQAGDLMQDLKTGHLLRASPRAQFVGQLVGSLFSVFFTVGLFQLFSSIYAVPGPQFPAPTAEIWIDMAKLVNGGAIATNVIPFCLVAAASAVVLVLVSAALQSSRKGTKKHFISRFLPSGIALAIGMYITPNWTLPRVAGAVLQLVWSKAAPTSYRRFGIITASGFVLGEGITSIVNAGMTASNISVVSCAGCPPDFCSRCP